MCKVIAILNKNPDNTEVLNNLMRANVVDLSTQKDGYSVYRDGRTAFFDRDIDYVEELVARNIAYGGEGVYITHFRISTGGDDGHDGLHLHSLNDRYVFAHNGTVGAYAYTQDKSDSYHFFKELIETGEDINKDLIELMTGVAGFSGRGFLYDEHKKEMHMFSTSDSKNDFWSKLYIYGFEDALVFASYELELDYIPRKYFSILGMPFWKEEDEAVNIEPIISTNSQNMYYLFRDGAYIESAVITPPYATSWSYGGKGKNKYSYQTPRTQKISEYIGREIYLEPESGEIIPMN